MEKCCPKKINENKKTLEEVKNYLIQSPCPFSKTILEKINKFDKIDINKCECKPENAFPVCPKKLSDFKNLMDETKNYLTQGKCPYTNILLNQIRDTENFLVCKCENQQN